MSDVPEPTPDQTIMSKLPDFKPSSHWVLKKGSTYRMLVGELRSMKVGKNVKVNMWDTNTPAHFKSFPPGKYADFKPDVPGPTYIVQNLDIKFKFSIDIRFVHNIAGKPANAYDMTIKPLQFDNVVIPSGEKTGDYTAVSIPEIGDTLIVSQISAREHEWPHQIVFNGSVYFKYISADNNITFEKTEGFPANCDIVKDDVTGFTITLKSVA